MISSNEITKKIVEATLLKKGDLNDIITQYMQELLFDMGNRYAMNDITHHLVTAAFKMHADMLYSQLDEEGKRACDDIIEASEGQVQEIRMPIGFKFNKGDKQGDTAGGV